MEYIMYWNKEEIEDLKLGYEIGLSCTKIGEILGRTAKSVKTKAARLGLQHPNNVSLRTHKHYVQKLAEKCSEIIVLDKYINSRTKILHKCLVCGEEYLTTPNHKLQGWGHCGYRNNGGNIIDSKPGIVYLVYISIYDLYKIGITGKTVKERFKDNKLSDDKYEIILERHFDSGIECEELEKEWLSNIQEYKINTGLLATGNTETFRLQGYHE